MYKGQRDRVVLFCGFKSIAALGFCIARMLPQGEFHYLPFESNTSDARPAREYHSKRIEIQGRESCAARSHVVSRQHIQKLVNEMLKEGTIDAIENPAHKRSKLLRLTPKGEEVFAELTHRIAHLAESLADEMDIEQLQTTLTVLQHLHRKVGATFKQLEDEVS
ncbi:hypothetical protein IQ249_10185 [Lusitaniella coriacea LEGE 07157]|uniref:MarR family transcriptional regulator n=1 Tax=Lusitaniella coriacea LEGE 07157 TaxID=945747 RepID=A0A8J7DWB6_9CYAN|nr:hypothetical protein [Lusitaniella coriacea]MBE9116264.1 hypothetical protein [Lusitaniella coriacea LEGE 07157]